MERMGKLKHKYFNHNKLALSAILGILVIISVAMFAFNNQRYKEYTGLTQYPNCMKLDTYDQGNDEGCFRHTTTLTPDYQDVYSLAFETFYMVDDASAHQKYLDLLQTFSHEVKNQETIVSDVTKVSTVLEDNQVYFIIQDDCIVYKSYGINAEYDKKQKWFDVLQIDFKIPAVNEI